MAYQPVIGDLSDEEIVEETPVLLTPEEGVAEDDSIQLKTEWKRKGDRVNFFTKEAATADFFDLLKAPAESLKEKTVIDGWLTKQGGKGITQNWRNRWFVLTYDKYLYYYKSETDLVPTGVIFLEDYGAITPVEDGRRKFRFNLHNNDKSTIRVFRFFSETEKERLQWISAIEQVIKAPKIDNTRTKIVQRTQENGDSIRRIARLYVRVGEARDLPKALTGSSASSYCIVDLQDKQVRTQTIWSTREPMWMEEFYLDVCNPNEEIVKITCWRMEKSTKGDVIGKVEIPVQSLSDQKSHEQWYPLASADAKQYIAGEVHLKLEYKPESSTLLAQVVAAKNLAPKGVGGTSNPFIRIHLGKRKKKTKTINKTLCPTFNDLFEFKLKSDDPTEMVLMLWHRDLLNTVFMGKIVIPYTELEPNFLYDGWYVVTGSDGGTDTVEEPLMGTPEKKEEPELEIEPKLEPSCEAKVETKSDENLTPTWVSATLGSHRRAPLTYSASAMNPIEKKSTRRASLVLTKTEFRKSRTQTELAPLSKSDTTSPPPETKSVEAAGLGSIRLVLKYTEETVLPDSEYTELLDLLMEENFDVICALGSVTSEKEDVGRCLSHIFEYKGKAEELIIRLTCAEVEQQDDPDVLFRANSLATKAFDYYLKLVGLPYLHDTLGDVIKEVYTTKKPCEVDPTRIEKTDDVAKHFVNLRAFADEICDRIFNSTEECPHKIRRICYALQQKVIEKYKDNQIETVKYTAISGFLFLRFFCPSILGPKLFDLMKDHPDMKTSRTLTLLAKTLQNLSNLCEFGYKEAYMKDMNDLITERTPDFRRFVDIICTLPDPPRREDSPEINYGREMATIHRHLINNLEAMQEMTQNSPIVKKLQGTLDRLALVREGYELLAE